MAVITSIVVPSKLVRSLDTGLFNIDGKPVLPAAANGDQINLFEVPHAMRATAAHLRVPAGLGAASTLKMRRNRGGVTTDMTAPTTANTAGVVSGAGLVPMDLQAGDIVELVVGGGALTAGQVEFDVSAQRA